MKWWEFFDISEDASINELKDVYLQALQEADNSDLDQKIAIQYYYQQAKDELKDRESQSNVHEEEEKQHNNLRKVQFKKIEQPLVDIENEGNTSNIKKRNKSIKVLRSVFIVILFVPFMTWFLFVELCRLLFKYYKKVIYLLLIIGFGIGALVFSQYRNHKEPAKQPEIISKQTEIKSISQNELFAIRMKEAQKFYEQNSEKVKDKELAVVKITACTVKFSETHTYQHPPTGNAAFDAGQQKYDNCFDV